MRSVELNRIKILAWCASFVAFFVPILFVYATHGPSHTTVTGGAGTLPNPLKGGVDTFNKFIEQILDVVIKIGVPIAGIAIIYSGFLFVTAQGNDDKITQAKSALTWSIIGTTVLLGAKLFADTIRTTIDALG